MRRKKKPRNWMPRRITPRQLEAVRYAASGNTIVQSAALMGIAPETVVALRARVMRFLGVHSTEAVIYILKERRLLE